MYGWEVLGSRDTGETLHRTQHQLYVQGVTVSGFHGGCPDIVANRQPLVGAVSYGRVVGEREDGPCEEPAGVMPPVGGTPP